MRIRIRIRIIMRNIFVVILAIIPFANISNAQTPITSPVLLVDFGRSASQNQYGLPGWNNIIKSAHTAYTSAAGVSGTTMISGTSKYDDYQGLTGPARTFAKGEQIAVTWYNKTGASIEITPLIAFSDVNNPVNQSGEPQWHAMTKVKVPAYSFAESTYDILSEYPIPEVVSAGPHSVVNVSLNRADKKNSLICDKIEIRPIDSIPPQKPGNLAVTNVTPSKITIQWSPSTDNVGVEKYLIYANDKIVGETSFTQFEIPLLQPSTSYKLEVIAMDAKRNKSVISASIVQKTSALTNINLINPLQDIEYKGAFNLPGSSGCNTSECEWSYASGQGLAFNSQGDPGNSDNYPGSLFGLGKTKYASEISIPEPIISSDPTQLNTANTLKAFTKIFYENGAYNDQPVGGLTYLPPQGSQTRSKLYYTRAHQHKSSGTGLDKPVTHGLAHADLINPVIPASWYIGPQGSKPNYFSYHSILFNIPEDWANANGIPGYTIASSGFRDGAAPNGPGIIAISPWQDQSPYPGINAQLSFKKLLEYESDNTKGINGYHIGDKWEGGTWLRVGQKSAVALGVKKAYGEHWYGMPQGPEASYHGVPSLPGSEYKSWHASRKSGLIVLYDPNDLADVLSGTKQPYQPQPYAAWDVSPYLYNAENIRAMDFDPQNGYLYVFEKTANGSRGIIHVWKVGGTTTVDTIPPTPPANLQGIASTSSIQLSWSASLDNIGVLGYKIFRDGVEIGTVSGTSYTDTGLAPNTLYTYTVQAYDAAGNYSLLSESVSSSTSSNNGVSLIYGTTGLQIDKTKTTIWHNVMFPHNVSAVPAVLANMQTHWGGEPAGLRLQNLSVSGMELKIEEEKSLDNEGNHTLEDVGYLALAPGLIKNSAGAIIGEAGSLTAKTIANNDWKGLNFQHHYTHAVVRMQVSSFNGQAPCHIRLRNVNSNSVEYQIEEWDYDDQSHSLETISYVVFEAGDHLLPDGVRIVANTVDMASNGNVTFTKILFSKPFPEAPVVLSQSQTYNDPAAIVTRQKDITAKRVKIRLVEEEAADQHHGNESVGYIAIGAQTIPVAPDELPTTTGVELGEMAMMLDNLVVSDSAEEMSAPGAPLQDNVLDSIMVSSLGDGDVSSVLLKKNMIEHVLLSAGTDNRSSFQSPAASPSFESSNSALALPITEPIPEPSTVILILPTLPGLWALKKRQGKVSR